LVVSDRGRGFTPEQINNIGAYMQFDRQKQEQQGLGLGLAIARRLTELHGGGLTIQSEPGQGSRVTIKLPKPGAN
jgi:signal transduction histidine kinase